MNKLITKKKLANNWQVFTILVWIVFFMLANMVWIFNNTVPPPQDQSYYLTGAEILHTDIVDGDFGSFFQDLSKITPRKAPLLAYLTVPLYQVFGSNYTDALGVNVAFLITFAIFFYLLVKILINKNVALVALIVTTLMPLFYGLLRNYFVEFGLMTLVVVWLYVLHKTNYLTSKKYLVVLGIVSGLGILMKVTFPIFVFGPLALTLYKSFKSGRLTTRNLDKILYVGIPFLLIATPWYLQNLLTVLWHAKRATNPQLLGEYYFGPFYSLGPVLQYILGLINVAISSWWFFIIIIFSVLFIISKKKLSINLFIVSWFIFPFLVFLIGPNKDYRLILPILPAIGIFIAWIYLKIFQRSWLVILPIIIVWPLVIFLNTTLFKGQLFRERIDIGPFILSDLRISQYIDIPRKEDWPIVPILNYINYLEPKKQTKKIILASEHSSFNINNLQYFSVKERLPFQLKTVSYFPEGTSIDEVLSAIDGDYLIIKVDGQAGSFKLNRYNEEIISRLDWKRIDNDFRFPDGGYLMIFENPMLPID